MHADEMCRGLLMCTEYYGCTCPVGLTGALCDEGLKNIVFTQSVVWLYENRA